MNRTRMSLLERKGVGLKQNQQATQRKQTPTKLRVVRKFFSVNMVNKGRRLKKSKPIKRLCP